MLQQLRHDLRNMPNHVFGDHRRCSKEFWKFTTSSNTSNVDHEDTESQHKLPVQDDTTLEDQITSILCSENEHDALNEEIDIKCFSLISLLCL